MRRFLKTQRNLSLSFDGLTEGSQPVYTVHICTPDRWVFLLRGDVFYGSHNSAYITELLDKIISEIGIERIASIVSDDTNVTKKARRDLTAKYPTIINLADPCHKLNLVIQDICLDEIFAPASELIALLRGIFLYFNHSVSAIAKLDNFLKLLGILCLLKSPGQTRFATIKISAESVLTCMPGLYRMNANGDLDNAPEDLKRITRENSYSAMNFMFGLKRLLSILNPLACALLCLESSHAMIGDNHIMWMASLSAIEEVLSATDCPFTDEEITHL
ncbi:hypothetical protein FRC08_006023 [Ceratobasidium sp. 394]|nr:hypothetical protein FRC08_006023 [Ceratobasidium sp. 394]